MSFVKAAALNEFPVGGSRAVELDGVPVLLVRLGENDVAAVENACSHDGSELVGGAVEGAVITCPRHGAQFDLRQGKALRMPAASPIEIYPVRLSDDGWIEVDVD